MICVGLIDASSTPIVAPRSVRPQPLPSTVTPAATKRANPYPKRRRSIFMISTHRKRDSPQRCQQLCARCPEMDHTRFRLEIADGGITFLDEIAAPPSGMQRNLPRNES